MTCVSDARFNKVSEQDQKRASEASVGGLDSLKTSAGGLLTQSRLSKRLFL